MIYVDGKDNVGHNSLGIWDGKMKGCVPGAIQNQPSCKSSRHFIVQQKPQIS